jgi:hypothetical protein
VETRQCQLCGNLLTHQFYLWDSPPRGRIMVCSHCNDRMAKAISDAAWNRKNRVGEAQGGRGDLAKTAGARAGRPRTSLTAKVVLILFVVWCVHTFSHWGSLPSGSIENSSTSSSSEPGVHSSPPSPAPQAPPLEVNAATLVRAYDGNEVAADQAYKGKTIRLTATVQRVGKAWGSGYVVLQTPGFTRQIQCEPDDDGWLSSLAPGMALTVIGECDGLAIVDVYLKHCHR